jgi:hypothetical protein
MVWLLIPLADMIWNKGSVPTIKKKKSQGQKSRTLERGLFVTAFYFFLFPLIKPSPQLLV